MPFDIQRVLALAVLLCAWSTVHCQAVDLPISQDRKPPLIQGWTEQDRQGWYHTSAGTQLIPYDWFIVLENEPLKNSFARTGILADPAHPDKLPIGFSKTEGPNVLEPQVGLTCAFCHTTQFTYQGNPIRIEGGPSLQYNQRFLQILLENLGELKSPDKFVPFATRVLQRRGQEVTQKNLGDLANQLAEVMKDLLTRGGKDASPALWGPGRFDALGRGGNAVFAPLNPDNLRPANAPVSFHRCGECGNMTGFSGQARSNTHSPEISPRSLV
ncbi:MAG: di-heme-cytochrome C peroxidase [Nitrospira sp.]